MVVLLFLCVVTDLWSGDIWRYLEKWRRAVDRSPKLLIAWLVEKIAINGHELQASSERDV